MLKNKLMPNGELSKRLLELEVFSFSEAISFVQNLPYGRTKDRAHPNLVLDELKGTCSTKHALIKKIALEQNINCVKLYLCLFKMNGDNTPKLTTILKSVNLEYIPEAHCILKIDGKFVDITNATSSYENLKKDVLELMEIQPEQIGDYKQGLHKKYLKVWLENENCTYSFEDLWQIREQCIDALSQ